jgi:chemotaxis protein methyltransferase CheR
MAAEAAETVIHPDNYRFLQQQVYEDTGIVLDHDKHYLIEARLMPLARSAGLASVNELCVLIRASRESPLRRQVAEAMTTNETYFFREPAQYEALKNFVIPQLVKLRETSRKLSFWSAAASTGQEAYSLAMMLLEMGLGGWNIEILGTDLCTHVLERAPTGRYQQVEVNRGLPVSLLLKYFEREGLDWRLKNDVRRMVRFEQFDLRSSMSKLGPFDVVFCRNVLIYFDAATRHKVLQEIHGTLFRGGYLLLGASENIGLAVNKFERRCLGEATLYEAV